MKVISPSLESYKISAFKNRTSAIFFADVSIFGDDVIKKPSKYDKNLRYGI